VRARALSVVGLELLLLAAVYVLALGTRDGLALDSRAILDAHTSKPWAAHWTVSDGLHAIAAASFLLMGAAVAAMLRRDVRRLAAAALLVVGAAVTAQLLKPGLAGLGLFDAGSAHGLDRSFPSGHAATALALGLALVDAAPAGRRWAAAVFAVGCSTALGIGMLTLGWHYPSDVVGGFLLAGAWAAATTARRGARERPGGVVLAALVFAAAGCAAVPVVALSHLVDGRAAPPAFAAGIVTVAACATVVTVGTSRLLGRPGPVLESSHR
jgi:membrane-associated phospholipid phosphatase